MSKRKKSAREVEAPPPAPEPIADEVVVEEPPPPPPPAPPEPGPEPESLEQFARSKGRKKKTAAAKRDVVEEVISAAHESEPAIRAAETVEDDLRSEVAELDVEMTVNVAGDLLDLPGRDDLDEPTINVEGDELSQVDKVIDQRRHVRGALEALVFASDVPIKTKDLAKLVQAPAKQVEELLEELQTEYATRGLRLEEVGGGWVFRTSADYSAYVRDLRKERPVRLSRAQVETLAIIAYRQPVTRPEIDDVRGVDSGPVLKLLLERDLVRILGKRDEVGRPIIYGTTPAFLEFFGLNSLKDLPTLREFTELTDESREKYEEELGEMAIPPEPEPAPAPPPPVDDAKRAEYESYEGDDELPSDDDPTELNRRPDTLVDEAELNNEPDDEDDDDDDDDDDDEDDDDDDEDEDDDDDE
ncbi:MAG: SMC-Scp complex subunit ScpB [Labilithrix sp.]